MKIENESSQNRTIWLQLLVGVLVALCSGSLGFGFSQMTITAQVNRNTVVIDTLQKQADADRKEWRDELQSEEKRTDSRIFTLAGLVQKVIDGNTEQAKISTELIQLIKLQNQQKP